MKKIISLLLVVFLLVSFSSVYVSAQRADRGPNSPPSSGRSSNRGGQSTSRGGPNTTGRTVNITVGKSVKLKNHNSDVTYTSSKPEIISIDANGNITALKAGSSVVTRTYNGISREYTFVAEAPRERILATEHGHYDKKWGGNSIKKSVKDADGNTYINVYDLSADNHFYEFRTNKKYDKLTATVFPWSVAGEDWNDKEMILVIYADETPVKTISDIDQKTDPIKLDFTFETPPRHIKIECTSPTIGVSAYVGVYIADLTFYEVQ